MTKCLWAITAMACLGGCVEREMTINSEPAGALVLVSNQEVGRTPLTIPFTWYGDYEIILSMEGYQTLTTHANINVPAYEIPPFDLCSEIAPWTYHDRRYVNFTMQKLDPVSDQDLIKRAEAMKKRLDEPVKP